MVKILLDKNGKAILRNGAAISLNEPTPSIPTTLGSRIDNKATVVGVLQDHEGNDYVLAVVDAAYRSGSAMAWGTKGIDTPLQNNSDYLAALADAHSGKYNTDLILSTYTATDYPAFNFARNACTVSLNGNTYYSVLPSVKELQLLWDNKDTLDQYDPTVSQYSNRALNGYTISGYDSIWASNENNNNNSWVIGWYDCDFFLYDKSHSWRYTVVPVICIPLI